MPAPGRVYSVRVPVVKQACHHIVEQPRKRGSVTRRIRDVTYAALPRARPVPPRRHGAFSRRTPRRPNRRHRLLPAPAATRVWCVTLSLCRYAAEGSSRTEEVNVRDARRIAVIGAGTMGAGVAYVFAAAGCSVELVDADTTQLDAARRTIETQADRAQQKGKLDATAAEALPGRVQPRDAIQDLPAGLDLVIEAVPERAGLKREVLE